MYIYIYIHIYIYSLPLTTRQNEMFHEKYIQISLSIHIYMVYVYRMCLWTLLTMHERSYRHLCVFVFISYRYIVQTTYTEIDITENSVGIHRQ